MNTKLILGEKFKDLRYRRNNKLILADVLEATGISVSILQRLEGNKDTHVGYQDIVLLARFYDVSAVFLFGLTDLKQYRNIEVDTFQLPDEAVTVLKEGKLNNRLINEPIAHADSPPTSQRDRNLCWPKDRIPNESGEHIVQTYRANDKGKE